MIRSIFYELTHANLASGSAYAMPERFPCLEKRNQFASFDGLLLIQAYFPFGMNPGIPVSVTGLYLYCVLIPSRISFIASSGRIAVSNATQDTTARMSLPDGGLTASQGDTFTSPNIPDASWKIQQYRYLPGTSNVCVKD